METHQLEDIKSQISADFMEAGVIDVSRNLNDYERVIERIINSTHFINKKASNIMRKFCDDCLEDRSRMLHRFKITYQPADFEDDIQRNIRFIKNKSEVNNQFRDLEVKGINEILTKYEIITSEQTQNKQVEEQEQQIRLPICVSCKQNTECEYQNDEINKCKLYSPTSNAFGDENIDTISL